MPTPSEIGVKLVINIHQRYEFYIKGGCMTDKEKGYLAGFIDGEGALIISRREHINYGKSKESRYIGYSIYIDIGNTNREVLEWIKSKVNFNCKIYENQQSGNRKLAYRIRISFYAARPLIEDIKDLLIIKKKQAEIFLKWPYNKKKSDTDLREELFQQMKILNKRGIDS